MRAILLTLLITISLSSFGQEEINLKRRYLGSYKGTVPAYTVDSGLKEVEVASTPIIVHIEKDAITVTIGSRTIQGTYTVLFKADKYYMLDATMNGELVNEKILVYKRGKKLSRDGMYPQPVTELKKFKR